MYCTSRGRLDRADDRGVVRGTASCYTLSVERRIVDAGSS
jgi:hypothetical protein